MLALSVLLLTACEDHSDLLGYTELRVEMIRLDHHRQAWDDLEPAEYSYEFKYSQFFAHPLSSTAVRIHVVGGGMVGATYVDPVLGRGITDDLPAGSAVPPEVLDEFGPVESMFEYVEAAIESRPALLEVEYDETFHYPTRVLVSPCLDCLDAGESISARALTSLAPE